MTTTPIQAAGLNGLASRLRREAKSLEERGFAFDARQHESWADAVDAASAQPQTTSEEIEAVIACLGDDAAQIRQGESAEDSLVCEEWADTMDAAAKLIAALASRLAPQDAPKEAGQELRRPRDWLPPTDENCYQCKCHECGHVYLGHKRTSECRLCAAAPGTEQPVAAAPKVRELTDAARDVLAERQRQVEVEGWDVAHDDEHDESEMALAAACYAMSAGGYAKGKTPPIWPWALQWWKPAYGRRDLVRAGALILAEIERLDRAAAKE